MTVIPFPGRSGHGTEPSTTLSLTTALDVMVEFDRLAQARAAGAEPPNTRSLREAIVRIAARSLLQLDDLDRGATS